MGGFCFVVAGDSREIWDAGRFGTFKVDTKSAVSSSVNWLI